MKRFAQRNGIALILFAFIFAAFCAGMLTGRATAKQKQETPQELTGDPWMAVEAAHRPQTTLFQHKDTAAEEESEAEVLQSLGEFRLTAYCSCEICCGYWATIRPKDENGNPIVYTASGTIAEQGRTVAVDPAVIPYGTEIIINGHSYVAEDCGGAINGNDVDIYFADHEAAREFAVQYAEVFTRQE